MRISDWSSDVCSSDLSITPYENAGSAAQLRYFVASTDPINAIQFYVAAGNMTSGTAYLLGMKKSSGGGNSIGVQLSRSSNQSLPHASTDKIEWNVEDKNDDGMFDSGTSNTDINILEDGWRSEEHTSELQSLMRISYAVFCLKKKNKYTK